MKSVERIRLNCKDCDWTVTRVGMANAKSAKTRHVNKANRRGQNAHRVTAFTGKKRLKG